jgi:hypothetical protein
METWRSNDKTVAIETLVQEELELVGRAIRRNPKSYVTWYHRLWVVRLGYADLERELDLTRQFLRLDSRNCNGRIRRIAPLTPWQSTAGIIDAPWSYWPA